MCSICMAEHSSDDLGMVIAGKPYGFPLAAEAVLNEASIASW